MQQLFDKLHSFLSVSLFSRLKLSSATATQQKCQRVRSAANPNIPSLFFLFTLFQLVYEKLHRSQMPPNFLSSLKRHTHPLIWIAGIICATIAIAVIIAGIVIFIGYVTIRPKVPSISVIDGHLDRIRSSRTGLLEVQMKITVRAENQNSRAHASFSETDFILIFDGIEIASLVAHRPFKVDKMSYLDLHFLVESSAIPLNPTQMQHLSWSVKRNLMQFDLRGSSRTRWRVGVLGPLKFWCRLNCHLRFYARNGSYVPAPCSSKEK